jgi:hypothetical protein
MSCKKSSEARQEARDRELLDGPVRGWQSTGVPLREAAPVDVFLPQPNEPSYGAAPTRT